LKNLFEIHLPSLHKDLCRRLLTVSTHLLFLRNMDDRQHLYEQLPEKKQITNVNKISIQVENNNYVIKSSNEDNV